MFSGADPTLINEVFPPIQVKKPKLHPKKTDVESWAKRLGGTAVATTGLCLAIGVAAATGVRIAKSDLRTERGPEASSIAPSQNEDPAGYRDLVPSRNAFADLVKVNPSRLKAWILSGSLDDADVSFAAEALGEIGDQAFVPVLMKLAEHAAPLVREGAIYGLRHFLGEDNESVVARLRHMAEVDSSPGVRMAARDVLIG